MRRFLEELLIIVTILFTLSGTAHTGETGHYASGLEGIKAATLPGPGLYYKMYNLFYNADELKDKNGNKLKVNFDISVFANAHRLIWVSGVKILGADYVVDATIPFNKKEHFKVGQYDVKGIDINRLFTKSTIGKMKSMQSQYGKIQAQRGT